VKFLCALLVLWAYLLPSAALDRHAFTFTHYALNARIEPEQQRLAVRGKIKLRNDTDSAQKTLSLQISSSLNWISIQFEGKPVEFVSQAYTSDIDHTGGLTEAIVVPPGAVPPKQTIELEIAYEGVIPQDATRLTRMGVTVVAAKHSDWDQISSAFTAVRGIGYVAWYPMATEAANLSEGNSVFEEIGRWKQREREAQFDVDLCVSGNLNEVAPGNRMNEPPHPKQEGAGYEGASCSDHPFHPLGVLVPTLVVANDSTLERSEIEIHYLPKHRSGAEDYALAVEQVVRKISTWFGDHRARPEFKAEVIDLPDLQDSPFESGNILLMPVTVDETMLLLSAARQLTQLYFPSPRVWISQGLAAYAQARYVEEEKGREAGLMYVESHRGGLIEAERRNLQARGDRSAETSLINASDEFFLQAKAMNVWWMLKDMVGESALSAALKNYKSADDSSAYYIEKLIEAETHRDLEWFFDDWIYRDRGLPDFRIASVYPREMVNGGYMVTVTVENQGSAGAEVPVTAHMSHGDATERLMVKGNAKATVRVVAPAMPQEISVNDGSVPERETTTHVYKIEVSH
jgi:hypothetical protein